jgi:hypothetical protein
MGYSTYEVTTVDDFSLAKHMSLEHACLFVAALFEHYYNEPSAKYVILREPDRVQMEEDYTDE